MRAMEALRSMGTTRPFLLKPKALLPHVQDERHKIGVLLKIDESITIYSVEGDDLLLLTDPDGADRVCATNHSPHLPE